MNQGVLRCIEFLKLHRLEKKLNAYHSLIQLKLRINVRVKAQRRQMNWTSSPDSGGSIEDLSLTKAYKNNQI